MFIQALIDATSTEGSLDDEVGVRMVALFDHEEIGSNSAQGAGSPVMLDAISRVTNAFCSNVKVLIELHNNYVLCCFLKKNFCVCVCVWISF